MAKQVFVISRCSTSTFGTAKSSYRKGSLFVVENALKNPIFQAINLTLTPIFRIDKNDSHITH